MQANFMQLNVQPVQKEAVKAIPKKDAAVQAVSPKQPLKDNAAASSDNVNQDFKDVLASEQEKTPVAMDDDANASDKSVDNNTAAALAAQLYAQAELLNIASDVFQSPTGQNSSIALNNAVSQILDSKAAELNSFVLASLVQQDNTVNTVNTVAVSKMSDEANASLAAMQMMNENADSPTVSVQPMLESEMIAKAADLSMTGKNISDLIGAVTTENDSKMAANDSKNAAIRNLDFLAKVNVDEAVVAADEAAAEQTEIVMPDKALMSFKNLKVTQISENVTSLSNSLKIASENPESKANGLTNGVLTDEQLAVELKNSAVNSQIDVPRAVTSSENTAKIVASLSEKLQALNEAMGISSEPEANINSRIMSNQTSFAQTISMTGDNVSRDSAASAAESKTTAQTTADYDIPKQIVEQARLFKTADASEMVIKLKPAHLGELTLKVIVGVNGAVSASFRSDNPEVRGAIESSLLQLKQELQQQGLKVDNIDVDIYSGQEQLFGGESGGNAAEQHNKQPKHTGWEETDEENLNMTELDYESISEGNDDSVDYLV